MFLLKSFILLALLLVASTNSIAQQGPPPKIDNTIRATVQFLMGPDDVDYKKFIESRYAQKAKATEDMQTLIADLKIIKQATQGAGGIDVAVDNGEFKIIFSDGNDATVLIDFEKDEVGKIRSLKLEEAKDHVEMTAGEQYSAALKRMSKKIESLPAPKNQSDAALSEFIDENFANDFKSKYSKQDIIDMLKKTRTSVATSMTIGASPFESKEGSGIMLEFRGPKSADVSFIIEEASPYKIKWYEFNQDVETPANNENLISMTWSNYQNKIKTEVDKGFSGVIYVVRDGKIVLAQGYGFANREEDIKNSKTTVFDIGSVPIDFTIAAILRLVDMGKITYEDPITKFLRDVPSDKKSMTIGHLMTNKSGLPNFHHNMDKDKDNDLSWITRDEAINRILSNPLIAAPGKELLPSHSGYGLLAAIIEIITNDTYENFLKTHFFKPMGMKNTGPYGKASKISPKLMAVGYGKQVSKPNIPAEWGETSWLIKGSGGMVSTANDLYTWNRELQNGNYLSQASIAKAGFGNKARGGSERGFITCYLKDASNTIVICSNATRNDYADTFILFDSLLNLFN